MKRKTMTMMLCLLCTLALVSEGFASWVISVDAEANASGSIEVDTVTDNRVYVSDVTFTSDNSKIYFGAPATMNKEGAWLTNTSSETENLVVTFTFNVYSKSTRQDTDLVDAKVTGGALVVTDASGDNSGKTAYDNAIKNKYIQAGTVNVVNVSTGKYKGTITFAWGEYFKNSSGTSVNPYDYFNSLSSADYADVALSVLQSIEKIKCSYSVKITIKAEQGE